MRTPIWHRSFRQPRRLFFLVLWLLLVVASASSCNDQAEDPDNHLLLWHTLGDKDAVVLDQILDEYIGLHPDVSIVREQIPADEIQASYEQKVNEGLGPDIMLITDFRLFPLLAQDMIRDLSDYGIDLSSYDPMTLSQVHYKDRLVGIPFSIFTQVLCYNQAQIKNPPSTLDEMLSDAESGHRIGLQANFSQLAWIMPALGGRFLNESGQAEFDEGEVTEWFDWLVQANNHPNIIISRDIRQLQDAFIAGELAYFVCPSELISGLRDSLGEDKLAVAILPAQPGNTSSAYFTTDILVFNPAADPGSIARGLNLARFLTNPAQQTTLALQTQSQIPVNINVDIDQRLAPIEATLLAQPKAAAALDDIDLELMTLEVAEPYVQGVLDGDLEPTQAAAKLARLINDLWKDQE